MSDNIPDLYRVSLKQEDGKEYISIFLHSDIENIGPHHTYSSKDYGWIMLDNFAYGAINLGANDTAGLKAKHPFKVGDIAMSDDLKAIQITDVIETQMDLARFKIDCQWALYCAVHKDGERLREKLFQIRHPSTS